MDDLSKMTIEELCCEYAVADDYRGPRGIHADIVAELTRRQNPPPGHVRDEHGRDFAISRVIAGAFLMPGEQAIVLPANSISEAAKQAADKVAANRVLNQHICGSNGFRDVDGATCPACDRQAAEKAGEVGT